MRKSPRERRLAADYESVKKLSAESTIFSFQAKGSPPKRYRLIFEGSGFRRDSRGNVVVIQHHEVLVELGAAYPRMVPNLAWQTPVFHPNISNNGVVCLGGYGTHWVPSLTLSEMATMLWDMIRYKNFDTESPYNREAALWAKNQTDFIFPIDKRSIRDQVTGESAPPVKKTPPPVQVTRVTDVGKTVVEPEVIVDGIEIIETGIQIVEPGSRKTKNQDNGSGIVFLD